MVRHSNFLITMMLLPLSSAFIAKTARMSTAIRLFSSLQTHLSRPSVLIELLSKHGAPGSKACTEQNDLQSVRGQVFDDLHPYLEPLVQSSSSGHIVCAYRNPFYETDATTNQQVPYPIVEAKIGEPGFHLLALNSEHLMRRIVCEVDGNEGDSSLIDLYNQDNDTPYERGSVQKLGYGVDKYVLMRVGPFADIYQQLARGHADEQSSLIAAETANRKLAGFGSNFLFYAELLSNYEHRQDESRDAARMCLRLPLATIGITYQDLTKVAKLGQLCADESIALDKLKEMYEMIQEDDDNSKTMEQQVMDECTILLDEAILSKTPYSAVRSPLGEKLRSIGKADVADFVELAKSG